jgi:hypothetical protein
MPVFSKPNNEVDIIALAAVVLMDWFDAEQEPIPQHDSILTGKLYYEELMNTANESRFRTAARMDKETFIKLLNRLKNQGGLEDSKKVSAGEKLMTFIHAIVGFSNRQLCERWQHSGSTISDVLHDVASSLLHCREGMFPKPTAGDALSARIANDSKYFPFFEHCIGALDGTHISAVVSPDMHGVFRNRKQVISQNVLGVVNFELMFQYALVGWEGTAHDGRVFDDAMSNKGLPIIEGKYYLGDAGYALSRYCLTPYRGVRYHLKEWARGNERPMNKEELFNLRHASLRNAIERSFGVLKKRFPLLINMHSYDFPFQCDLVLCAIMIHNFIRSNQLYDDEFDDYNPNDEDHAADDMADIEGNLDAPDMNVDALNAWRDGIAQQMWDDYLLVREHRGLV